MYLVTGASGNVGSEVARQLLEAGQPVRVFARDPAKLGELASRVEVATGDFDRPDTLGKAALGTKAVFLNLGPHRPNLDELLAALKANGAPRVVFLSSKLASEKGFILGDMHKASEDAIRAAGLHATVLRPGGFMSNTLRWTASIEAGGEVHNAMGTGKSAPIAPEDIAAVAVRALLSPELAGETLELTGGELLSVPEQVAILAEVLGRPLRSVDVPVDAAVQGLIGSGVPAFIARGVAQSLESIRDGRGSGVTKTVERITGVPPRSFRDWAQANAARFA